MKLINLELTDFCNHKHSNIDLAPITIIHGNISSGKTPLGKDAIEWVFTDSCRNMKFDNKRHDAASELDLIRIDGKKAIVTLSITNDKGTIYHLRKSRTKSTNGFFQNS